MYQWDDQHVVAERDGSGNILAEYAFYPGIDRPHSVTVGDSTYYFASEPPGNVIGLMGASGSGAKAVYRYKPFGAMERNDQTVANSLRFQARPYDAETGLYYFRARYYDPELARFVSEDPIGLEGGLNQYAFGGNDPSNSVDPAGLNHSKYRPNDCSEELKEYLVIDVSRQEVISYCAEGSGGVSLTGTGGLGGFQSFDPSPTDPVSPPAPDVPASSPGLTKKGPLPWLRTAKGYSCTLGFTNFGVLFGPNGIQETSGTVISALPTAGCSDDTYAFWRGTAPSDWYILLGERHLGFSFHFNPWPQGIGLHMGGQIGGGPAIGIPLTGIRTCGIQMPRFGKC